MKFRRDQSLPESKMAAQTVFSMFPVGVSLMEDGQSELPRDTPPAPQLVMLANVAAVTAAEGAAADGSAADEKEMMELKTVGCSYSDSEDDSVVRYNYENQNQQGVCILEYPESPGPGIYAVVVGKPRGGQEEEEDGDKAEDLSHHTQPRPPPAAAAATPEQGAKRKDAPPTGTAEAARKKKPFHCKPCHFQAQNEQDFVQHLSTHGISKMMVVNRVEGRSKTATKEAEAPVTQHAPGGEEEGGGGEGAAGGGDIKGLIRCERCGYNTNRYDHYIAHLKHHSKQGEDHRVFKCTLCPYTTVSQYHWRKHLRNHFPSKLHTCSQCSYFSDRKSNYIQHIRTHTGVRPFQCPYCEYSSSQKTHLTRHMRTHSGERPFKCESCNYLAANQHEVTRHARQVHNGPKPLSCPYCEYKTADRSNFKKHVELHLNPRQFLCPLCKYAASKKCNLQYHIKSRHSGCNVAVDISKVKLRVKKPGPDGAEEDSRADCSEKLDSSSGVEEDLDQDQDQAVDSSPINLSIKQSEAPDKMAKKSNIIPDKLPKVKEKVELEKKLPARQKKNEKVNENLKNTSVKEAQTETPAAADKTRRRAKRPPAEKTSVQNPEEATEPEKDQTPKSDQQKREDRAAQQKVEEKLRPDKEKDHPKNESSGKENKSLNKPRKTGTKKSDKTPEHVEKPDGSEKIQKEKLVKDKATKRRAAEALDLSNKSETPPKARRLKAGAAEKLPPKPASEDTKKTDAAKSTRTPAVKQRKTRNTSRKAGGLQQAVDPAEDQTTSVSGPSTDAPGASAQTGTPEPPPSETSQSQSNNGSPPGPEHTRVEAAPPSCSSGEAAAPPTFVKPTSPPALVLPGQRGKPTDPEDDEGIHSSHEGGSDISDSASEGSDDSGLHSNGAGSGKMVNDPETPTDEIPTPTELKSHMCIFCDRTFPLEVEYRRHLNRHLVNVRYMDAAKAHK